MIKIKWLDLYKNEHDKMEQSALLVHWWCGMLGWLCFLFLQGSVDRGCLTWTAEHVVNQGLFMIISDRPLSWWLVEAKPHAPIQPGFPWISCLGWTPNNRKTTMDAWRAPFCTPTHLEMGSGLSNGNACINITKRCCLPIGWAPSLFLLSGLSTKAKVVLTVWG